MNEDSSKNRLDLNKETAQFAWHELQRHFAAGMVLHLKDGHDLVEIAFQMSQDNTDFMAPLIEAKKLAAVEDQQALDWYERDVDVWGIIVHPWIIVQENKEA
ncbi:MAG: DUF2288 domain-containing protein [Lentisphaeria bacterium]|nr:DUF2288 domain-containing protein [Lentisphaeria bacterium]